LSRHDPAFRPGKEAARAQVPEHGRRGGQPGPAHEHTHAVLTLRESMPDDQFYDVVLHLPNDYVDLLMPGGRAP
jgi:hypothetical protein